MTLPSLELDQQPVFCAPNAGTCTFITGTSRRQPILVSRELTPDTSSAGQREPSQADPPPPRLQLSAAGDCINILDRQASLLDSLPFELAFPVHDQLNQRIDALAFDPNSGRVCRFQTERPRRLTF